MTEDSFPVLQRICVVIVKLFSLCTTTPSPLIRHSFRSISSHKQIIYPHATTRRCCHRPPEDSHTVPPRTAAPRQAGTADPRVQGSQARHLAHSQGAPDIRLPRAGIRPTQVGIPQLQVGSRLLSPLAGSHRLPVKPASVSPRTSDTRACRRTGAG